MTPLRLLLLGPTSRTDEEVADELASDLATLARPRVDLAYRTTGAGPVHVRTTADEAAAAPHVVAACLRAEADGYDAVVVDCVADPGVAEARTRVRIPVVGVGEVLAATAAGSPAPLVRLGGDDLRAARSVDGLPATGTVVLEATGFSDLAERLRRARPRLTVLDPLPLAVAQAVALATGAGATDAGAESGVDA